MATYYSSTDTRIDITALQRLLDAHLPSAIERLMDDSRSLEETVREQAHPITAKIDELNAHLLSWTDSNPALAELYNLLTNVTIALDEITRRILDTHAEISGKAGAL